MKLYYCPGACSLSPHIVLKEVGAEFELIKVDLKSKKTEHGEDYSAINPKAYVPALGLDQGDLLTEGPAIVQYIADLYPQAGLAPKAGTLERARLQEWLSYISTELHKSFGPLFHGATGEARQTSVNYLQHRLNYVEAQIGDKPYLLGQQFSVADAYLFTVLGWAKPVKLDLSAFPRLQAFYARVGERPKVQEALREEGLH